MDNGPGSKLLIYKNLIVSGGKINFYQIFNYDNYI